MKLNFKWDFDNQSTPIMQLLDDDGNDIGKLVQAITLRMTAQDMTPTLIVEVIPTSIEINGDVTNREQIIEACRTFTLDGGVYTLPTTPELEPLTPDKEV